ncbi:unnamed protein product [Heterobilharzia americana]|nr:unnamed protein product [Heterobilharzia americana]
MKIPNQQQGQQLQALITIDGKNLEEVVSFIYLPRQHRFKYRRRVGGTDEEVKAARIKKTARQAFINLKSVWRSTALHCTALSIKSKIRIFNTTNVKSVFVYG